MTRQKCKESNFNRVRHRRLKEEPQSQKWSPPCMFSWKFSQIFRTSNPFYAIDLLLYSFSGVIERTNGMKWVKNFFGSFCIILLHYAFNVARKESEEKENVLIRRLIPSLQNICAKCVATQLIHLNSATVSSMHRVPNRAANQIIRVLKERKKLNGKTIDLFRPW